MVWNGSIVRIDTTKPSDNPYNFIPPADDDFVTMALVPYYNPTTGFLDAPTGGWRAPDGWVIGTKEDYEASINSRRSKISDEWEELDFEKSESIQSKTLRFISIQMAPKHGNTVLKQQLIMRLLFLMEMEKTGLVWYIL